MPLVCLRCCRYGNYFINPEKITFISCGEAQTLENGDSCYQIFIHFVGGKESAMLLVRNIDEAITCLNT